MQVGRLQADVAFWLDPLSAVMVLVITGVGFLIHIYSLGYMAHDPDVPRYFTYLNLFVTAMLVLVLADNLLLLFVGWEGVGLCSYLLIGFWWTKDENCTAGKKAMLTNRVGDACFLVGLFLLIQFAGTLSFQGLDQQLATLRTAHLGAGRSRRSSACCSCSGPPASRRRSPLRLASRRHGRSTPVSALIHAATMVTAGVYLTCRLHGLVRSGARRARGGGGGGRGDRALRRHHRPRQTDIKKVLAYSTVSQLGTCSSGSGSACRVRRSSTS